jgi:hypothetical protein
MLEEDKAMQSRWTMAHQLVGSIFLSTVNTALVVVAMEKDTHPNLGTVLLG